MYTKLVSGRLRRMAFGGIVAFCLLLIVPLATFAQARTAQIHPAALPVSYQQTNLVSDVPGMAPTDDFNLINPWGLVASSTGPWWVSDNNWGTSTLYNGQGQIVPLVANIPSAPSSAGALGTPTGIVFNSTAGFVVSSNGISAPSSFIFSTEDGTISGWSGAVDSSQAFLTVDRSKVGAGAVYKGLAIGTTTAGTFIYAANFRFGTVEMFNSKFQLVKSFTDPRVPKGFAPFGIQNIGGNLFVSYALQNAVKHDDIGAVGNGFVDIFTTNGTLVRRLISRGQLDSPWGMTIAPANFGAFSNALLVGNFRNGLIHAYNAKTGALLGQVKTKTGAPLVISGLWALQFGNGAASGKTNELFFTAGINAEANGLFGKITSLN